MSPRKIRALIVDDSAVSRQSIKRLLEQTGLAEFSFIDAQDGVDALQKFSPDEFDLLFVDMHMPRMSGLEFLGRIHTENTVCPPAVMVTAESNRDRLLKVVNEGGVSALLMKPVKLERMRQGLKKVVDALPLNSGEWQVAHSECAGLALEDTLDKLCGVRLQPLAEEAHTNNSGSAVFSMISFSGSIDWLLHLGFDEGAAVTAASQLAGEQLSFESPDLLDAIAEVTNTVAGRLKARLMERGMTIRMALPTVMSASGLRFHRPAGRKLTSDKLYFSVVDADAKADPAAPPVDLDARARLQEVEAEATPEDADAAPGAPEAPVPQEATGPGVIWIEVTVGMESGLMF